MATTAVITARMQSTRIPRKVMQEIRGKPIIEWVIDRLRVCKHDMRISVAMTTEDYDDELCDWCVDNFRRLEIDWSRGNTDNLLERIVADVTAEDFDCYGSVIRLTADLPFLSYEGIDALIDNLGPDDDYLNNIDSKRPWLDGTNAEIMWADTLLRANRMTPREGNWRQHGFVWARQHPELFRCRSIDCPVDSSDLSHIPICVDEPFQLEIARLIAKEMYDSDDSYQLLLYIMRKHQGEIEEMWRQA